ncbi:MAG TPA: His/Gly/Thr/Pro-type tRNA ligase C-terminal domain-containing protein, partial [Fimbriimonadaceae bacterium]|nr:His/Gly/Thr/Pro-type tRNA ligase C-terminal domain-containing protein [Fimbriimonadaceae bacterium]
DDKGFVCPPRLAPVQIAIVPLGKDEETRSKTYAAADALAGRLRACHYHGMPLRVKVDKREKESPGFKYNDWELHGACIRIELGPRDLEANQCVVVRRDASEKITMPLEEENTCTLISGELADIQHDLYQKALAFREENTHRVDTWEEFEKIFQGEGGGGFVVAHWDGTTETEEAIAAKTKATIRCIPLTPLQPDDAKPGKCVLTGKPSERRVVFAKAY